jgi:hypothetical protein
MGLQGLEPEQEHAAIRRRVEEFLPDSTEFLVFIEPYLEYLTPPERNRIKRLIVGRMRSLIAGKEPTYTLPKLLEQLIEENLEALATVPPSTDKAKGSIAAHLDLLELEPDDAYEAMALLPELVAEEDVALVVSEWKEELRDTLARQQQPIPKYNLSNGEKGAEPEYLPNPFPPSYIFWSSRDFEETKDAITRYKFMETFNIGEFRETEFEIEAMFASTLTTPGHNFGDVYVESLARELYLASRSTKLRRRIRPFIDIALTAVANQQTTESWWYTENRGASLHEPRIIPSNYGTALACVVLLRLSRDDWQLVRAMQCIQWLVQQQKRDGAWAAKPQRPGQNIDVKPDLFTTLLSAEAIRLSGLQGYDNTLRLAESWLLAEQNTDGTWRSEWFPWPFMTALVVEYFDNKLPWRTELEGYLSIGRDFLLRSQEFVVEDNANSRRLAIVTAFQGIEAFLYGCLEKVNIPIFRDHKPRETIGMRAALRKLEVYQRQNGSLRADQSVPYRNSLDKLAYHRDEIVHKAASVGKDEAHKLAKEAGYFADIVSQQMFGFHLL